MDNMLKLLNDNSGDTVGQIMAVSEKAAEYGIRLTEKAAREIALTEKSCISENRRICFGKSAADMSVGRQKTALFAYSG